MRYLALALSVAALPVMAQEEAPPVTTTDLGGGIYALTNDRAGNVGVLAGEDGVFMIDTQMPAFAPSLEEAIKAISGDEGVDLVLNTHLHGDHVLGNAYFASRGATIMAHPNVRPGLEAPNEMLLSGRTPEPVSGAGLPTVTVNEGTLITMNGQTAHLYHAQNAHTDGDIFVVFEEADVIHSGDLVFHRRFPFIDLDNGGSVKGYIAGMERIVEIADEDTAIISGHGPMASEADLQASIDMLRAGHADVMALVEEGRSLEEIKAAHPLADYEADWSWGFIDTDRMVWTLYRDITGLTE